MNTIIDKLAFICLKDKKILMALTRGKDVYYIPGGKREAGESDVTALKREVMEELSVQLKPETITFYGVFEAQAHGKPPGTSVRMTCYVAEYEGILMPGNEIQSISYYSYAQRSLIGPVDKLIFDDLYTKKLLN